MKSLISLLFAVTMVHGTAFGAKGPTNQEFNIGISQEFESMNPMIMTMMASTYMYNLVGRALVSLDAHGKWYPQLAKSIPSLENGGAKFITVNGKKVIQATWEILDNANWSDGKAITCADFKLARTIAESPNVSVGSKETFTMADKIEWDAKTPKKCVFTYDKARWDFYQLPSFYPLPSHLEGPVFEKYKNQKEGYEKNSNYVKNPTLPGLYNGPYVISEVKLGSHVTFTPNSYFYGTQPKIQKIVVKYLPNTGTLEANLRSGTIDSVASLGFTFDQAIAFDKKAKAENLPFTTLFVPSLTYEHIDLNLDNPILKDLKVRKALVYSINRDELVKALFDGKQKVAIHSMAEIDPWFTSDPKKITLYPYSKREANRLLDEAGWKMGADGVRTKDGKRLSFQFMTTAGNKSRETVQTFLQNQWKSVGIDVTIKNEPARVFFGETTKKHKFGGMAMYAWISSPESVPRSTLHSSNIPTEKNGWSGQNNMSWSNKKVDALIDQLEQEFDPKKRADLAHQIAAEYTADVPVIPLYYRSDIAVNPKQLKNFSLPGHQFSETNQAENWSLE